MTDEENIKKWAEDTTGQTEDDIRRNVYRNKIQLYQMKRDESRFAFYYYFAKELIKDKAKFCANADEFIKDENHDYKKYKDLGLDFIANDELAHAKVIKAMKKVC